MSVPKPRKRFALAPYGAFWINWSPTTDPIGTDFVATSRRCATWASPNPASASRWRPMAPSGSI